MRGVHGKLDIHRRSPTCSACVLLAPNIPVTSGAGTRKTLMNDALRDWVRNVPILLYHRTVSRPQFLSRLCADFQSIIGEETREQIIRA